MRKNIGFALYWIRSCFSFGFMFLFIVVLASSFKLSGANQCVSIPPDMKLCQGLEYTKMVLPNLLNHESLNEARQQATSFVPLLAKNCHTHLKQFLCSLFAPVCLPPEMAVFGPIPPCRSLCRSVERSCLPVLRRFGFHWPEMLNCNQFRNEDPCINFEHSSQSNETDIQQNTSNVCAPCGIKLEEDTLRDNFCASEFVLKIKAKRIKVKNSRGIREIVANTKKRTIFKSGPLGEKDLRRMKLIVQGEKQCECRQLDNISTSKRSKKKEKRNKLFYLVMGRKDNKKLYVNALYSWSKNNKVLRKAGKSKFWSKNCPSFSNVFSS